MKKTALIRNLDFQSETCKTKIIVVDTMMFAPTLKSVYDQRENNWKQKETEFLLIKLVNIPVEEKGLIFIEKYLDAFHIVMMFFVKEYI